MSSPSPYPAQSFLPPGSPAPYPTATVPSGAHGAGSGTGLGPVPSADAGRHQAATPALVVGILAFAGLGFAGLSLLLAPFAWSLGRTARREIEASGGRIDGLDSARAGAVLGLVGTICMVAGVLLVAGLVVLGLLGSQLDPDGVA